MADEADSVMYEIYRDRAEGGLVRVVYFTELDERSRDQEITRAMAGEHLYDGYFAETSRTEAKAAIIHVIDRLNAGDTLTEAELGNMLEPF